MHKLWHDFSSYYKSIKKFHVYIFFLILVLPLLVMAAKQVQIHVEKVSASTMLGVDVHVGKNQQATSTISSPKFSTQQAGELIVVLLASDGPEYGVQTFSSVTGGGLTFTLAKRANAQAGTSEIWYAYAKDPLTDVVVSAKLSKGKYAGMIDVVTFTNAANTLGTAVFASGSTGAPYVSLTTTVPNSWVWGVGNDWDRAVARKVGTGQSISRQFVNRKVGDTFWTQKQNVFTPTAGTQVMINDTFPTNDRWNLVAVEIVPQVISEPTITPTPTVGSSTPSELPTNCQPNPSRCGYPDATNTGVPVGTSLTKIIGDITINTQGAVIDGKDITGCIRIEAPGVTIKNTKITCTSYYGIFTTDEAVVEGAAPLTVADVEIICGPNTTGIAYANLIVKRAFIHGCENGFGLDEDATVSDTYITDIKEINGGHGDGMQFGGAVKNIIISHNSIIVKDVTSAINWTDDTVSMRIENNLLAGGNYTIYCPRVPIPPGAFKVMNNRFGDFTYGHQDACDTSGVVFTDNYEDTNLQPIMIPSVTGTPGPSVCPSFPAFPDANCTGWQHTGVTLRTCVEGDGDEGDGHLEKGNITYDGCDFTNGVVIQAPNIHITRSRIRGVMNSSYHNNPDPNGPPLALNAVFTDVEIVGASDAQIAAKTMVSDGGSATNGYDFTCIRCNIHHTPTGISLGDNNLIQDSYIHDVTWGPEAHQAAIGAGQGAGNHSKIIHNNIQCNRWNVNAPGFVPGCSSALSLYDEPTLDDVLVQNNLFNTTGGYCTYGGGPRGTNIRYIDNYFGKKYSPTCGNFGDVAAFFKANSGNVWSGNVWEDGSGPVNP